MTEKISKENEALQVETSNPPETHSIDTEQIKAQEEAHAMETAEAEKKGTEIDTGAGAEKEEKEKNQNLPAEVIESGANQQEEQKEIKQEEGSENETAKAESLSPFRTYSVDTEQIRIQEQKEEGTPEKSFSIDTEQIKAQENKEWAEKEFPQMLKGINEAREKKQKEVENSFYATAPEVYKEATGEDLGLKVDEMAHDNLKEAGMKIMKIKDYLSPERVKKSQEEVIREERSSAILRSWETLSAKEREIYTQNGVINSDKFISDLTIRKKALAEKQGVTEAVFNRITNEGLDIKNIKKRGFFGQMFGGAAIEIPTLDGSGILAFSSKKKFKEYLGNKESEAKNIVEKEAKRRMDKKIIEGQARLRQEKNRCVRKIFQETVEKRELAIKMAQEQKMEAERQAKIEQEKAKPKNEIVSRMGRERTPGQIREMEKMRKKFGDSEKRVKDLIKKQRKGKLLTAREVGYLRAIELSQRAEKETKIAA